MVDADANNGEQRLELTWCLTPIADDAAQPLWWRWHQCGPQGVLDAGEADCAQLKTLLPLGQAVVMMVPPQWLSWHWVPWRPVRKAQELAYAKGVLSDLLYPPHAALHLALGPLDPDSKGRWAAVTQLALLQEPLAWLQTQSYTVTRIVPWWPAPQPQPNQPATWMADVWQEHIVWQAWGPARALSLQVPTRHIQGAKPLVDAWCADGEAPGWCHPAAAHIIGAGLLLDEARHPLRVRSESQTLIAALNTAWDLAQGALSSAPTPWYQRLKKSVQQWLESPAALRSAAALLGVMLLNAAGLQWVANQTHKQQAFWRSQQLQVAQKALPPNTVVVDPARQLQLALGTSGRDPAATTPTSTRDPWLQVLNQAAQAQQGQDNSLVAMEYQAQQRWLLQWQQASTPAFEAAISIFANSNWQLQSNEVAWTATAKR